MVGSKLKIQKTM